LCFDQFIWKLSHKVFSHVKATASLHLLDKQYKKELETRTAAADNRYDVMNIRYATILKQKRFQLLGRAVNISQLVAYFCNQHLRSCLDIAISRFEVSDLTGIVVSLAFAQSLSYRNLKLWLIVQNLRTKYCLNTWNYILSKIFLRKLMRRCH
jgi:hypothetical protein